MATKRPSFLKRQKEQKRNARALEKRQARWGRKDAKALDIPAPEVLGLPVTDAEESETT